jgi:S-adenosylmethionine:tRNA ribosyltransferase-isomerase
MALSDFDYDLPESFIAQTPAEPRDASRLLVLDRRSGAVAHHHFNEFEQFLRAGDVLVFNDTRVLPARLSARKAKTGGAVQVLLLKRRAPLTWEALVGGKRVQVGAVLEIDGAPNLRAVVLEVMDGGERVLQFSQPVTPLLEKIGTAPLPPYIHTPLADPARYQTVYANVPGSAAAPTAGLHFTEALLERLKANGMQTTFVTLHVGLDTFQPVAEEKIEQHRMHGEWCELGEAAAAVVAAAKRDGRRVIAVGTTSVRVLEAVAAQGGGIAPFAGMVDLFIYPGFTFRVVDALLTNFHLPKSTLLMLVSAFAGRENVRAAYEAAKREGYRFYSFGDAMLIADGDHR